MRFTDYDPMAWLYATRWGGEYHEQAFSILDGMLFSRLPRGARILDLCCGDGRIAQQLWLNGFDVIGIDGSERMLDFARERSPAVPFIAADARDFRLDRKVDAVISTFDALNHIMNTDELDDVFSCVYRSLNASGTFVFDLNREDAYTTLWSTTYTIVEPDVVCCCTGAYDPKIRTAHADFTVFRPIGAAWERSDFRMRQYCHDEQVILAKLRAVGFAEVTRLDAAIDLGMWGNIGQGRNYFIASGVNG